MPNQHITNDNFCKTKKLACQVATQSIVLVSHHFNSFENIRESFININKMIKSLLIKTKFENVDMQLEILEKRGYSLDSIQQYYLMHKKIL